MYKKVIEMIMYHVLAIKENHNIKECRDLINLEYDMLTNGGKDEYLNAMIKSFPEGFIVRKLYNEISQNGIEDMIKSYELAKIAFSKVEEFDFSNVEDDEQVEELAAKIAKYCEE